MSTYTQDGRPLAIQTPLGKDKLLLVGFTGQEAISQLFNFHLEAIAEKTTAVPFSALLGQKVTVEVGLPSGTKRYFNGIVVRVMEGMRGQDFTEYALEIVPKFWLLTRKTNSRIFQQKSVPDILREVLEGIDVSYKIQGSFEKRDYCVQYRETDFNFASRLMEEEGIYYFFEHSAAGHQMIVANTPSNHAPVTGNASIIFEGMTGGVRDDDRIQTWTKTQELRSGKSMLWDHTFELPKNHLEAPAHIIPTVSVGAVSHQLQVGGNDNFELYDFPGQYAQRFDGVAPGGADQPAEIDQKIFKDNARTVGIRMEEEALPSILIQGSSDCRQFSSGHKFTLTRHFDANGEYVLSTVWHTCTLSAYRSSGSSFSYSNTFTCFPLALPFRPARVTQKPMVHGSQSALVVGPAGEEIFTDKYGRVKVQFFWDRQGKKDAASSCWIRVTQPTAGNRWGSSFWPRIGQEVLVDFENGDPDTPVIVGAVYNADQMPPYLGKGPDSKHTNDNKVSGFKTCTTKGGKGYNELRFDDTKGAEEIFIHAERNMDERVKNNSMETIGNDRHLTVGGEKDGQKRGDQIEEIYRNKHLKIRKDQDEQIGGSLKLHIGGIDGDGNLDLLVDADRKKTVGKDEHAHIKGDRKQKINGDTSLTVGGKQQEKVGTLHALDAGQEIHLKAGMKIIIEAETQISLKVGGNMIDINPSGVSIKGTMVLINSGGAAGSGSGSSPDSPTDAEAAAPKKPDLADDSVSGTASNAG